MAGFKAAGIGKRRKDGLMRSIGQLRSPQLFPAAAPSLYLIGRGAPQHTAQAQYTVHSFPRLYICHLVSIHLPRLGHLHHPLLRIPLRLGLSLPLVITHVIQIRFHMAQRSLHFLLPILMPRCRDS